MLLKSTARGIPVFVMSCFWLPKSLISSLFSMMADYWWGVDAHKKKIHWISWETMCLSKQFGGVGFRDLKCFNQAYWLSKRGKS